MLKMKQLLKESILLLEFDEKTNIADVDAADIVNQLSQEDGSGKTEIWNAMMKATGWAKGPLGNAKGEKSPKAWVAEVGPKVLQKRIEDVQNAVKGAKPGLPKSEMPALEGDDAELVKDALSDKEGEIAVDLASKWGAGDGSGNFDKWWDSLDPEKQKLFDEPGFKNMDVIAQSFGTTTESKKYQNINLIETFKKIGGNRLGNLLMEAPPEPPKTGGKAMDGAPNLGHDGKGSTSLSALKGKAKAFLMKGMLDGGAADSIKVSLDGGIKNSAMVPTQGNILIGKSMLFALNQWTGEGSVADMGGAFITSKNEILDGHHRWSGGYIGTGGNLSHTGVHIVQGDAATLIPTLTVIGNALGRGNKGMDAPEAGEE